jgi:hypothetical protein
LWCGRDFLRFGKGFLLWSARDGSVGVQGVASECRGGVTGKINDNTVDVAACTGAQDVGFGACRRGGRAALFAAMRRLGGSGVDRRLVQRGDVAVVADHHPGAGRGDQVPGDHRRRHRSNTARAGRCGGDVEVGAVQADGDGDGGAVQMRRHGVAVAAEGHQRLRRDDPRHHQQRRELCRHRREDLRGGELGDGEPTLGAGPDPRVAACDAPPVQTGLSLLDAHVIGQGAPEPLRSNMISLLDHSFTVAPPRRTRPNGDAVVLGHRSERRADPAGLRGNDGRHPIETPIQGQPAQGLRNPVQAIDQMRLVF